MSVGENQFHGMVPVSVSYEFRPGHLSELKPPKPVASDREAPCQFWAEDRTPICPPPRAALRAAWLL